MFGVDIKNRPIFATEYFIGGNAHQFGAAGGVKGDAAIRVLIQYVHHLIADAACVPGIGNQAAFHANAARFVDIFQCFAAFLHIGADQHDDFFGAQGVVEDGCEVGYRLGGYQDQVGGDSHDLFWCICGSYGCMSVVGATWERRLRRD